MLWCILSHENILLLTLFTQIAHAHGTLQLLEGKSRKVGISIYFCATSTWVLFPEVNAVTSVLGTFPEIFHTFVISLDLHSGLLAGVGYGESRLEDRGVHTQYVSNSSDSN